MKRITAPARVALPLVLTLAVVLLVGCGAGVVSLTTDSASSPSASSPTLPEPAATTSSAAFTAPSTPSPTTSGPSSADVTAAVRSVLGLFEKIPRNPEQPSAGYMWGPAGDTAGHLSRDVVARLAALHSIGYFSERVCAADYFTGSQNLLQAAPTVVSAHGDPGGTVTVVIRRPVSPPRPDLTLVMSRDNGVWLAIQLATGDGPSASIFAAKPNC